MQNTWKDLMVFINDHPMGVALKVFCRYRIDLGD